MDNKPKPDRHETYVVATVALTCLSKLLMSSWIKDHSKEDLDELALALELKIKNADIEGLDYTQQEALIRRSVNYANLFLDVYRKKLPD